MPGGTPGPKLASNPPPAMITAFGPLMLSVPSATSDSSIRIVGRPITTRSIRLQMFSALPANAFSLSHSAGVGPCAQSRPIIVELSLDRPAYGQIRIANELRKLGHSIRRPGCAGSGNAMILRR